MRPISTSKLIFFALLLWGASFYVGKQLSTPPKVPQNIDSIKNATGFVSVKSERPELKFFVMSFCPYGNQMEDTLLPVQELLQNNVAITPQYIFSKINNLTDYCNTRGGDINQCLDEKSYMKSSSGTLYSSLHGRQEASQDVREICAWIQVGNDKKIWWNFIGLVNKNCTAQNADICWEEQGKAAGLDTNKITECFNKEAFNIIEQEIAKTTEHNVSGSPTLYIGNNIFPPNNAITENGTGSLLINNKVILQSKYRTPNTIKEALCASMKKPAKECATVLPEIVSNSETGGCGI